jgi:branched-subunit amino acid ABC-type transport system permease component
VSLVVQVIVTGLAAGGVYGIFAVGYSLIYRLTGVVYLPSATWSRSASSPRCWSPPGPDP